MPNLNILQPYTLIHCGYCVTIFEIVSYLNKTIDYSRQTIS